MKIVVDALNVVPWDKGYTLAQKCREHFVQYECKATTTLARKIGVTNEIIANLRIEVDLNIPLPVLRELTKFLNQYAKEIQIKSPKSEESKEPEPQR